MPDISKPDFLDAAGPIIECPRCGTEIKLTESLAAPMMESMRSQYEERASLQERKMAEREQKLQVRAQEMDIREKSIDEKVSAMVSEKLVSERGALSKREAELARSAVAVELEENSRTIANMKELLESRTKKLDEAQKEQAELIKLRRELEDKLRESDLIIQKQVAAELEATRRKARHEAEEELALKVAEKEHQIASMQKTIEELKRKAEQGSQQLQGEAQELKLEDMLRQRFIFDVITPVAKGERGGDVIHRVMSGGRDCGAIVWESKRTKNWSQSWIAKLKDDMFEAKADIAVLATQAMPQEIETFGFLDGVWVTSFENAEPVAMILRHTLIEISGARMASEGFATKTELLYQYLTGPRFRQRVQAIVESFTTMKEDLDKERRAITKQWEKREKQIESMTFATAGMYGELQGIIGKSIQEIEGMDLPALE